MHLTGLRKRQQFVICCVKGLFAILILVFLCPLLSHLDVQEHFEVVGF
jgi:hypothetical protein